MRSDDDQIVPYVASGPLSARLLRNGTMKACKDFPHGMPTTHAETINTDLLTLLRSYHASGGRAQRILRLPASHVRRASPPAVGCSSPGKIAKSPASRVEVR